MIQYQLMGQQNRKFWVEGSCLGFFLGCVGLGVYLFCCCWLFVDLLLFVVVVFQRYKVAHQRNKQPFIYIPVDDKSYKPS